MPLRRELRIAVVSPLLPIKPGSHRGHSLYQTVIRFPDRARVEAFCPITLYPKGLEPRSYNYTIPELGFQPEKLKTTFIKYRVVPILSRPVNGFLCFRRLKPYLLDFKPDLILNSWLYPEGYASMLCGQALEVPVVHYCVGSDLQRIPDPFTDYFTKRVLRHASGIIAKSEDLARIAVEFGAPKSNTRTILNGFDRNVFSIRDRREARSQLKLPLGQRIVLYAGNIVESKGVVDLVRAVAETGPQAETFHVYLLGGGPYSEPLSIMIKKSGLTDRITLQGPIPNHDMPKWFAACNLFCLPSHSEGCPNVIVEARACGRPVVATHVGGIPEITNSDCAILVPPRSPKSLARAILEALERNWESAKIAEGLSSWEDISKEALLVCERALNSRNAC